jgi:hypothetical protein
MVTHGHEPTMECKFLHVLQIYPCENKFWKFYFLSYSRGLELRTNKDVGVEAACATYKKMMVGYCFDCKKVKDRNINK